MAISCNICLIVSVLNTGQFQCLSILLLLRLIDILPMHVMYKSDCEVRLKLRMSHNCNNNYLVLNNWISYDKNNNS